MNRQHPKLIVVDIDGFLTDEDPEKLEANLRKWLDNMPWSRNRIETIRTCVPAELQTSFYFNIAKYHANWYQPDTWLPVQQRLRAMDKTGYSLTKSFEAIGQSLTDADQPDTRPLTLSGANAQYLRDFCAQAQALGANVLFLRMPHRTQTNRPNVFADVAAVVAATATTARPARRVRHDRARPAAPISWTPTTSTPSAWETFTAWFGAVPLRAL